MSDKEKSTHTSPGGTVEENSKKDDGVVNDSLGTVDPADSTGLEEDKETCGAQSKKEQKSKQ